MYGELTIFQAFDEEVCHKAVHKAGHRSDQYEDRRYDEHRLYFLDEQDVCEEELCKVMEESSCQTQPNRPEEPGEERDDDPHSENACYTSAQAQDESRPEE